MIKIEVKLQIQWNVKDETYFKKNDNFWPFKVLNASQIFSGLTW